MALVGKATKTVMPSATAKVKAIDARVPTNDSTVLAPWGPKCTHRGAGDTTMIAAQQCCKRRRVPGQGGFGMLKKNGHAKFNAATGNATCDPKCAITIL